MARRRGRGQGRGGGVEGGGRWRGGRGRRVRERGEWRRRGRRGRVLERVGSLGGVVASGPRWRTVYPGPRALRPHAPPVPPGRPRERRARGLRAFFEGGRRRHRRDPARGDAGADAAPERGSSLFARRARLACRLFNASPPSPPRAVRRRWWTSSARGASRSPRSRASRARLVGARGVFTASRGARRTSWTTPAGRFRAYDQMVTLAPRRRGEDVRGGRGFGAGAPCAIVDVNDLSARPRGEALILAKSEGVDERLLTGGAVGEPAGRNEQTPVDACDGPEEGARAPTRRRKRRGRGGEESRRGR